MDVYVEISPYSIKLSIYIRRYMPSFKVVFTDFRIPLAHGIPHFGFRIVTSAPPDLERNLGFEFHFEMNGCIGKNGFRKVYHQNGLFRMKSLEHSIHFQRLYFLKSD